LREGNRDLQPPRTSGPLRQWLPAHVGRAQDSDQHCSRRRIASRERRIFAWRCDRRRASGIRPRTGFAAAPRTESRV